MTDEIVGGDILSFGDSVTVGASDPYGGYVYYLNGIMNSEVDGTWTSTNKGEGSNTIVNEATEIDARLAGTATPVFITLLFGQNDQFYNYTETQWKTAYRYVLDAIHTAHSSAPIYLGLGGNSGYCLSTLLPWMNDLLAERPSYCFMGINQPVLFAGHIAEYMEGSAHPNTAGHLVLARAWADIFKAALGLTGSYRRQQMSGGMQLLSGGM